MQDDTFACVTTATALYWTDLSRMELCQYAGGDRYEIISKTKNVNTLVRRSLYNRNKTCIKIVNDKANDEVIFGLDIGSSIAFNEVAQLFYSTYTYPVTTDGINFDNILLFNYKNTISKWDDGNGEESIPYIWLEFIINE
jgi:hypothetical protein|nr:MAG TPA: hypothetical protein [Caudoviricetes sp.]